MKRSVLKFGGSSVETIERLKVVAERIIERKNNSEQLVIVLSAMGKTTNELLSLARRAALNPSKREIDLLISTGEQMAVALLAMILNDKGCPSIALTGYQAGIKTVGMHTKNKIVDIEIERVINYLEEDKIVVIAGFQGVNEEGDITTLGRGGSDTTAVALAAKLNCSCEIYTDVEGVFHVDPKLYKEAKKINVISYNEMKEMSFLGAKVMEPRSIEIAHRFQVPIYVASSHQKTPGTYIMEKESIDQKEVIGLCISEKVMMINLSKVKNNIALIADIFIYLANNEIYVDIISQIESLDGFLDIKFIACNDDLYTINCVIDDLIRLYPDIIIEKEVEIVKVSVVGNGMRSQTQVIIKLFDILTKFQIPFKFVITSEISISIIIDKLYKDSIVQVIAENFNL